MSTATVYVADDPGNGGYRVCDSRDGAPIAWRSEVQSAVAIASELNAAYPAGSPAPAYDSLVHEVVMRRIGGVEPTPLHRLDPGELGRMVPAAIGGPTDSGLWRPDGGVV